MWETQEGGGCNAIEVGTLVAMRSWNRSFVLRQLRRAQRQRHVTKRTTNQWIMTEIGTAEAKRVVRNHRLWEVYLINYADIAPSHVDRDADAIEHVLGQDMVEKLEVLLDTDRHVPSPHPLGIQP